MAVGKKIAGVGLAQILEFTLQVVTPIFLVRLLDADAFAAYRWIWLLAGTVLSLAPLGMVVSLFYFLPKSSGKAKLQFILQAALHLFAVSLVLVFLSWMLVDFLPGDAAVFRDNAWWVALFVVLWVVASLIDQLPTADENVRWQVVISILLSVVRVAALVLAAYYWRTVYSLIVVLCFFSLLKVGFLVLYVASHHRVYDWQGSRWRDHYSHGLPLGFGSVLFGLRKQFENWLVAALFTPVQFASFSIASALAPVMVMACKAIGLVLMPSMSRAEVRGDYRLMLKVNQGGNMILTYLMSPFLAYFAVYADVLVGWVYTEQFLDAANVLRVFVLLWALQLLDLNPLIVVMGCGSYLSRINLPLLAIAAGFSYLGATNFGLPGAAVGSVAATYIERILLVRMLAAKFNIKILNFQPWRAMSVGALSCFAFAGLWRWALDLSGTSVWVQLLGLLLCAVAFALISTRILLRRYF